MIFENLINYDNIRLIKETDINQSQISLLPWIGNFTQSFLHTQKTQFSFESYFFMNLNLFIIGSSFASPLHTFIIPIKAYITPKEYKIVLVIPFKNGNGNNIREFIIDTTKHIVTKIIKKFIP